MERVACMRSERVASGGFLSKEIATCKSSSLTRKSSFLRLVDLKCEKSSIGGFSVKLELPRSALRGSERSVLSGRRSSNRRGKSARALQENCLSPVPIVEESRLNHSCSQESSRVNAEAIEAWLEGCLIEIVRHLNEAPFLQYVFKSNTATTTVERQRLSEEVFDKPETWGPVRKCLLEAAPDGIVVVHKLDQTSVSECCLLDGGGVDEPRCSPEMGGSSTDIWGLLVHGCKVRCNACYILKTTRVTSSAGVLTHFCLSRAKCFGPSLKHQLENTWLL